MTDVWLVTSDVDERVPLLLADSPATAFALIKQIAPDWIIRWNDPQAAENWYDLTGWDGTFQRIAHFWITRHSVREQDADPADIKAAWSWEPPTSTPRPS